MKHEQIITLRRAGHSRRRLADHLDVDRETVGVHLCETGFEFPVGRQPSIPSRSKQLIPGDHPFFRNFLTQMPIHEKEVMRHVSRGQPMGDGTIPLIRRVIATPAAGPAKSAPTKGSSPPASPQNSHQPRPMDRLAPVPTPQTKRLLHYAADSNASYRDITGNLENMQSLVRRDVAAALHALAKPPATEAATPAKNSPIHGVIERLGSEDKREIMACLRLSFISGKVPALNSFVGKFVVDAMKKVRPFNTFNDADIRSVALEMYAMIAHAADNAVIAKELKELLTAFSSPHVFIKKPVIRAIMALSPKLHATDALSLARFLRQAAFERIHTDPDFSRLIFEAYITTAPKIGGKLGSQEEDRLAGAIRKLFSTVGGADRPLFLARKGQHPRTHVALAAALRALNALSTLVHSNHSSTIDAAVTALPTEPVEASRIVINMISHISSAEAHRAARILLYDMKRRLAQSDNRKAYRNALAKTPVSSGAGTPPSTVFDAVDDTPARWITILTSLVRRFSLDRGIMSETTALVGEYVLTASYEGKKIAQGFFSQAVQDIGAEDASKILGWIRETLTADDVPLPQSYRAELDTGRRRQTLTIRTTYAHGELDAHARWPAMAAAIYWKLAPKLTHDDINFEARQLQQLFHRSWSDTAQVLVGWYGVETMRRHIGNRPAHANQRVVNGSFHYTPFALSHPRRARLFSLAAYAALAGKISGMDRLNGLMSIAKCTGDSDSEVSALARQVKGMLKAGGSN